MPLPPEFIRWCKAEIAVLREQLEPLMSGNAEVGRRHRGGVWTDDSAQEIERLKKAIANLEAVLAAPDGAKNPDA